MAKAKSGPISASVTELTTSGSARPRLHKLIVRNFRCIGCVPIEIELDDVVVLVGANNTGKSSILRAYEIVVSHGSKAGELTLDDFPEGKVEPDNVPEIELHTVIFDNAPGERWITTDPKTQDKFVRERFRWSQPGKADREGFNVEKNEWDKEVPWGAPNVAKAYRPQPHRVDAFASPDEQAQEILKLLKSFLEEQIKRIRTARIEGGDSKYQALIKNIGDLQKEVVSEARLEIDKIEGKLTKLISEVFPGYQIEFDARPEDDLDKCISFFKGASRLLMGPVDGYRSTIDRQGSGARRTLLWTALRIIADAGKEDGDVLGAPHVLLMDEPELCLHPNAIREACRVLYELPDSKRWQVMITTHCPVFIDFSRDHTTVVRIDRGPNGVEGSTMFRPSRANLTTDDKLNLKLLNLCDPYVAEFFFGGKTVVVEGDTEYTAFKYAANANPAMFTNIHIIRARGKATIVSLAKILNQFGAEYSILHDSDQPTIIGRKSKKPVANGAWTVNSSIRAAITPRAAGGKMRLLASIPNFEFAYFGEAVDEDKPYSALVKIYANPDALSEIVRLLTALIDHTAAPPTGCVEWLDIKTLQNAVGNLMPVSTPLSQ